MGYTTITEMQNSNLLLGRIADAGELSLRTLYVYFLMYCLP